MRAPPGGRPVPAPRAGPFPPGLQLLADDFVASGYDVHRLIRLIAASDVFQRDSRAEFEITAEHEKAWAVFPLSRLRPHDWFQPGRLTAYNGKFRQRRERSRDSGCGGVTICLEHG